MTILITIIFGILRFILPVSGEINKKDIFKDMAHIWVGILFGLAYGGQTSWWVPIGLTALEVVAFIVRKKKK